MVIRRVYCVKMNEAYVFKVSFRKASIVNSIHNSTSGFERASLSCAVFAPSPAGVNEPALGASFRHPFCEHTSISGWMQDDERLTKTGGESGRRFCNTILCAWSFRTVVVVRIKQLDITISPYV